MDKKIIWGIVVAVILIAGGVLANNYLSNRVYNCCHGEQYTQKGISIDEPLANQEVKFPLIIKGYVSGYGWTAFEGITGSVQVLDANGKTIAKKKPLEATEDWMQAVVHFETTVGDAEMMSHLGTQNGVLVFENENPSGESVNAKEFRLPVKFIK